MTKDEVIAAMKEDAAKLGHVPSFPELERAMKVMKWDIRRGFGTYSRALKACGMQRQGTGYPMDQQTMFVKWAEVVRRLGKIPTQLEYEDHTNRYSRVLVRRCGGWLFVPQRMFEYMRMEHLEDEWKDVSEVILKHIDPARRSEQLLSMPSNLPSNPAYGLPAKPKRVLGQPMYGTPMLSSPLSCAPINELGVVFLFGAVARQMGFVVTRLQQEFPDCEALRQVEPDRWQRVLIEFEYESRNFLLHEHRVEDCDLIVCWSHNWPECPLEVLELKNIAWN